MTKKMTEKQRAELYVEGARLLRDIIDPIPRPGHMRVRPFNGSTADRLDRLFALENPSLEEAQELWTSYRGKQLHGSYGVPWALGRSEERIAQIEKLLKQEVGK